jgi:putative aminopeptidase FrvX
VTVDREQLLKHLEPLLLAHAPSGSETEVDQLMEQFIPSALPLKTWQDGADSIVYHFPGRDRDAPAIAVTAHKDEISMIIKCVEDDGRVRVQPIGGLHPWAVGEAPVEILATETVQGVLSVGSKHVSHLSPAGPLKEGTQLTWDRMWVETGLSAQTLAERGVRTGRKVVLARHFKKPWWIGDGELLCGYNIDCRGGLAILIEVALGFAESPPAGDVYLIASADEEIGGLGAVWSVGQLPVETVIAIDVVPVAKEYGVGNTADPALPCKDRAGLYHAGMVDHMERLAHGLGFGVQTAVLTSYASDATLAKSAGSAARACLIGYPGDNTHGYEISHVEGLVNSARLLQAYLSDPVS